MGFDHRKLLPQNNFGTAKTCYFCCVPSEMNRDSCSPTCYSSCPKNCKCFLFQIYDLPPPPPPPPPPPSPPPPPPSPPPPLVPSRHADGGGVSNLKHLVMVGMIVMSCVIAGMLLCAILTAVIRGYYLRRNNSRRTNPPIIFGTQEDFFDEDHGPVLDHPIWYINTVGLSQSIIDSIAVFKYKKDEGLIEGTECSVCLSEFEEDESLRLLPKCSHAFHVTCIDTWLGSHKNCPLCRAPIISGAVIAEASESEPTPNALDSGNGNIVMNLENYMGEGSSSAGEGGVSEIRNGNDNGVELPVEDDHSADDAMKILPHLKSRICDSGCRVLSDLAENWRVVEEDTQPIRRSVSLDSSAASMIYNAVANGVMHDKPQGNSNTHLGQSKSSKSKIAAKRRSGSSSSSICKLIKSPSIGSSLQKGPMSMKRSFSSSGRFSISSSRHSRHHSVLPILR